MEELRGALAYKSGANQEGGCLIVPVLIVHFYRAASVLSRVFVVVLVVLASLYIVVGTW